MDRPTAYTGPWPIRDHRSFDQLIRDEGAAEEARSLAAGEHAGRNERASIRAGSAALLRALQGARP